MVAGQSTVRLKAARKRRCPVVEADPFAVQMPKDVRLLFRSHLSLCLPPASGGRSPARGVPTLLIDGELFWGADSLPMALDFLKNPGLFETPEMQRIATLPVGASRK